MAQQRLSRLPILRRAYFLTDWNAARSRLELYGLNFAGIAETSCGVSKVICLTIQASGIAPGGGSETERSQSMAEQIKSDPLDLVVRCESGIVSIAQVPARSSL